MTAPTVEDVRRIGPDLESEHDAAHVHDSYAHEPPAHDPHAHVSQSGDAFHDTDRIERLVVDHLALARHLAMRYRGRGVDDDDLIQTARLALVLAARRFDPDRGDFVAFAVPTITGEIRRHFRDATWAVRVPRRVQELHRAVRDDIEDTINTLGREPSDRELAASLKVGVGDVRDARRAGNAYRCQSLDAPTRADGSGLGEILPDGHDRCSAIDEYESLLPAIRRLSPRDARILYLRFFHEATQSQIAASIGVSQMHVSRLLARVLGQLRAELAA